MSFYDDIRKWAKKTERNIDAVTVDVRSSMSEKIIAATPVDTGRAKNNWIPSIGGALLTSFGDGEFSKNQSLQAVHDTAPASPREPYYFVNNLPYIRRLKYEHWSKRNPNGMVRVTVQEFREMLTKAVRGVT